jgi:abortive infection bacteriophage resistance protein
LINEKEKIGASKSAAVISYKITLDIKTVINYTIDSDRVAETCEACDQRRTCGRSSFLLMRGYYSMPKIFLNYNQQIDKLKNEKNLQIDDILYAKEILRQTSYYSLIGGYKDIFKNPTTKKYKDGTKFEDIVELYYFDESLRQLFLKYIIKVENEIKSQLSYYFSEKYGESQNEYLNKMNYNYLGMKNQRDIDYMVKILEGYVFKPTSYHYINHAQNKYGNVPLWVLTNALTFGNISKMYMLITQDLQIKISKTYPYINEKQLSSLLKVLVKFRNVCAHGERLFTYKTLDSIPDLPIHKKLSIELKGTQYINGKNDLFSVVIALRYLLADNWYKEFIRELKSLIDKYLKKHESISKLDLHSKMGFPENWRQITRYRKI